MKKYNKLAPVVVVLMIVLALTLGSQRAGAKDCGFTASSWQLGIRIQLSPDAWDAARGLLEDYGVPEILAYELNPLSANVTIRENYTVRDDEAGDMTGNGQLLAVQLGLTVVDSRSPIGPWHFPLSSLFLKGFNTSVAGIQRSINEGWIDPGGMTAEQLKSDIVRTHRTQRYEEFVHAGEVLTQIDRVEYNLKCEGPAGEVKFQTSYLKRNDPTFFACGDCNSELCYTIGSCFIDDTVVTPRLYDFHMRATTYTIAEEDCINFNLKFKLEDETLAKIFEDKNNTIIGFEEQFRDGRLALH